MQPLTHTDIISSFSLLPHPEGGWYKENYRSTGTIAQQALPASFTGVRSFSTAIYFLLERGNFSAFHRIQSDECWHFYTGGALIIYVINAQGQLLQVRLGSNIQQGETFQYVVPAGCWFASAPADETSFSFVGCTVAPGFDFADFEMAERAALTAAYPQHAAVIKALTRV
jgi:predicted cupin superfamily sugar epimerase